MSLISSNFLYPTGFKFIVNKLPTVNLLIQRISLPSMSLGTSSIPTPFSAIKVPGNIVYSDLTLSFLVDENMVSYIEIIKWMEQKGNPRDYDAYEYTKYDAKLNFLNNSKQTIKCVSFTDIFPVNITPIDFDVTVTDPQPVIADVTLSFTTMKFE